jgi:hypothetical protein
VQGHDGLGQRRRSCRGRGGKIRGQPELLFLYRLALAMREPDVDALAERLTVKQMQMWRAYWRCEPFGDDWRRTGRATTLAMRTAGSSVELDFEENFLPSWKPPEVVEQTDEEIAAELAKIPIFRKQMSEVR